MDKSSFCKKIILLQLIVYETSVSIYLRNWVISRFGTFSLCWLQYCAQEAWRQLLSPSFGKGTVPVCWSELTRQIVHHFWSHRSEGMLIITATVANSQHSRTAPPSSSDPQNLDLHFYVSGLFVICDFRCTILKSAWRGGRTFICSFFQLSTGWYSPFK